jgi:hypothetical protein
MNSEFNGLPDEAAINEVGALGMELYNRLKPEIEAKHDRQYIAIHVDSGDYHIAKNRIDASRAMRSLHPPDGRIFVRKIGDEPDYAMAARILAGEMAARGQK